MDNQPTVLIARHGETDYNSTANGSPERLRGWLNVPLNMNGMMEAKKLSDELDKFPINEIYSSDLSRAAQTAETVAKNRNMTNLPTPMLRPWNLGDLAGQKVEDVIPKLNNYVARPDEAPPNGESFNDFKGRYLDLLSRAMNHVRDTNGTLLLATHTRNQQLTKAWLAGGMRPNYSIDNATMQNYSAQPPTGSFLVLKHNSNGWELTQHGEKAHE
jgi:phosphoserine phosphatase